MPDYMFKFVDLIENRLKLNPQEIDDFKRFEAFERLINASDAMQGKVGDFTGINICIHVASSFVLLESDGSNYYDTVSEELDNNNEFNNVDSSVILTSVVLFYMLQRMIGRLKNDNERNKLTKRYIEYLKEKPQQKSTEFDKSDMDKIQENIKEAPSKLEYIKTRFNLMNWMIGKSIMEKFDIPNAEYNAENDSWVNKTIA